MSDIAKEVREILADQSCDFPANILLEESLANVGPEGMDNTEILMMVTEIESHFDIKISDDEIEELTTVNDVVECVKRKKA